MTRNTAREIAMHLAYELSFTDRDVAEMVDERLSAESFAELAAEGGTVEPVVFHTGSEENLYLATGGSFPAVGDTWAGPAS